MAKVLQTVTNAPRGPEKVRIANDGKAFTLSFAWDQNAKYVRPVSKKTGQEYREVIAEVGNGFGHYHLGNGLYVKFQFSRGNEPRMSNAGSELEIE